MYTKIYVSILPQKFFVQKLHIYLCMNFLVMKKLICTRDSTRKVTFSFLITVENVVQKEGFFFCLKRADTIKISPQIHPTLRERQYCMGAFKGFSLEHLNVCSRKNIRLNDNLPRNPYILTILIKKDSHNMPYILFFV